MRLTETQQTEIRRLQVEGLGYLKIAKQMELSVNTVRSFCDRNGINGVARKKDGMQPCKCCGNPVQQNPGRKEKRFCSDKCRMKWWSDHRDKVNQKAVYTFTCAHCGKNFSAYGNDHRKYCSHDCYIAAGFGGDQDEH